MSTLLAISFHCLHLLLGLCENTTPHARIRRQCEVHGNNCRCADWRGTARAPVLHSAFHTKLVIAFRLANRDRPRLGRVVDALGTPIDGAGPIATKTRRRVELKAGERDRASVNQTRDMRHSHIQAQFAAVWLQISHVFRSVGNMARARVQLFGFRYSDVRFSVTSHSGIRGVSLLSC